MANYPAYMARNSGIAGQTAQQIAARVQTDVVAYHPDWCTVLAGTNNAYDADPSATITALTSTYDQLQAARIGIIACTIPPRLYTQGDPAVSTAVNAWIRSHYTNWSKSRLCDWNPSLRTSGGTEMQYDPTYFSDGVHPNSAGADVMASVLRPVLLTLGS